MTTAQFFVYRKPIAWAALVATLAWGLVAYFRMPQRQDPDIPISTAVVVTAYPGQSAQKVEEEITRPIEKKVGENENVENVYSTSRQGLSLVFVEIFDRVKDTEPVWQDLRARLGEVKLPKIGDTPLQPWLNKDFGGTAAVMLTVSSPAVSDLEIELRARNIRSALEAVRRQASEEKRESRWSGVLVYPNTVARGYVLRIGRTLLQRLTEAGVARDGTIVEPLSAGCIDFQLMPGKGRTDIERVVAQWRTESTTGGESHPDIWQGFWIQDLTGLEAKLRAAARDKYTYRELRDFCDIIRDRIKQSPNVAKVEYIGDQNEQITLSYSGQRFNQFGIAPGAVVDRLTQRNINLPGGQVELPAQNIVVRPTGEFTSEREIGEVVMALSDDGYPLYLRDLVDITRGYEDPPNVQCFRTLKAGAAVGGKQEAVDGLATHRAITLAIRQVKGTKVAEFGRDLNAALAELQAGVLPDDLRIERVSDSPAEVQKKIRDFDRNLLEAVMIVVVVALLFMEWRSAMLVAVSIPVTIAMTLGICQLAGIDLQQVSIAALIIALGLLVDDPVVAADAINRELSAGMARDVAAWQGPQKLARAILYATLTNIVAFLPLLLITGKTGDFIYSLPIVVTASLVSSRIVSMTFMPLLGYYVLRGQKGFEASGEEKHRGAAARFAAAYRRLAQGCLAHKGMVVATCAALLVGTGCLLPLIGNAFFPKDLHSTFVVNVYMPEGSPMRQTREEAQEIIRQIEGLEGRKVKAYTTFVGAGGPRFWLSVVPEQRADNYAQILVHTTADEATAPMVRQLKAELPGRVAGARVTIEQLETGPPIGVPVQLRIYGSSIEDLRRIAERVKQELRRIPGADNIHDDWDPEVFQIALDVDPDRANITGITNQDVAAMVYTGLSGLPVTQLREKDQLIDISLRLRPQERSQVNDLFNLNAMSTLTSARVPIRQIIRIEPPELVPPKIRHRNYQRCLTVKCDAVPGVLPSRVQQTLAAALPSIPLPPGYRFEFGGEQYEQAKGFASVRFALIVSLIAIYLALVLQFNSVTKPLLVFAAVPFGMLGGLMGLLLFGAPFGFMAFLGVASLAGVIVSHIIVLFDFIEDMRERGEPLRRAVVDAALVRLRPVLVTVLATVGGLVPLALEGGPLWEPMCYVQIAGLLVATVVTLVIVPVLYVIAVENLHLIRWEIPKRPTSPAPLPVVELGDTGASAKTSAR